LHGKKSLNHHYSVFRIKVPEAYLNGSSHCPEKRCWHFVILVWRT
jgi:tRNA-specific adenosine deaminase 3